MLSSKDQPFNYEVGSPSSDLAGAQRFAVVGSLARELDGLLAGPSHTGTGAAERTPLDR
jgi:hypothetical protein